METLNVTAARDQEQIYRILDNLISTNKEFRILISVPLSPEGTVISIRNSLFVLIKLSRIR